MEFILFVGVEFALFLAVGCRIQTNRRLQDELRSCHADLAAALAHIGSGDKAAAQQIVAKWPDRKRPPPPRRPPLTTPPHRERCLH
jgi:hypothetical protein